jgi:hypothetical protein
VSGNVRAGRKRPRRVGQLVGWRGNGKWHTAAGPDRWGRGGGWVMDIPLVGWIFSSRDRGTYITVYCPITDMFTDSTV